MDIKNTVKVIDQHVMQTIDITSRQGHIQRGTQPNFAQLQMQLVANQVVIMQCLKNLLLVLNEDIPESPIQGTQGGLNG